MSTDDVLLPPPRYQLDDDTALTPAPGGVAGAWALTLSDRWNIGPIPNGGYVLCAAVRALGASLGARDPLSVTGHYLRPGKPGPATIVVDKVREGRTLATGEARLVQDGQEILRVLGTFGPLGAPGPRWIDADPPPMPPLEECVTRPAGAPPVAIAARFEQRFDPATVRWVKGDRSGPAVIRAYCRFADGRPADTLSLPLFADALPPPAFAVLPSGWIPTIELTVHVRARPAPGWLRCQFRTRFVFGGFLEEDGEIWDESGQLVAQSRQLAAVPRSP